MDSALSAHIKGGKHARDEVEAMARVESSAALHHLNALFYEGATGGLTDGQLVERFVVADVKSAELAFAALVARHGPMILGVCRRILKDPHDSADAFQATFLVLVRKATTLRVDDSLGRWLHGVSRRIAMQARKAAARRSARQVSALESLQAPIYDPAQVELMATLDDEIVRLPAKYRTAGVLCDLDGLTHEAAARQLGCPVGTIASRLSRGRHRLRIGLSRRGFASCALVPGPALSTAPSNKGPELEGLRSRFTGVSEVPLLLGCVLRGRLASAPVPPKLARATVRAAILATGATARAIPVSIHALAAGFFEAMVVNRIQLALFALPLLALGAMAATMGTTTTARATVERQTQANPIDALPQSQPPEMTLVGRTGDDPNAFATVRPRFEASIEKVHVSIGQEVKKGDPLVDLVGIDLAAAVIDCQTSYVQWQNDLQLVQLRASLFEKKAIAEQPFVDARREEDKSRLAFMTSKERLLVFGVPEHQIDSPIKHIGNLPKHQQGSDDVAKGKLTLLAPIDGSSSNGTWSQEVSTATTTS